MTDTIEETKKAIENECWEKLRQNNVWLDKKIEETKKAERERFLGIIETKLIMFKSHRDVEGVNNIINEFEELKKELEEDLK